MAVGGSACPGRDLGATLPLGVAEPWIFGDGVFEVADAGRFGGSDGDVSLGKGSSSGDDQVLIELIGIKAGLQHSFTAQRLILRCATLGTSASRSYRLPA